MDPLKAAIHYFYPLHVEGSRQAHLWDGYAKFFEPCIPSRVGSKLISFIREGLMGDEEARLQAVAILETSHTKRVSHLKGVEPYEVVCHPTSEAAKAIELLKAI